MRFGTLDRRFDEGLEQRVPGARRGSELGVELHADEPRVPALARLGSSTISVSPSVGVRADTRSPAWSSATT